MMKKQLCIARQRINTYHTIQLFSQFAICEERVLSDSEQRFPQGGQDVNFGQIYKGVHRHRFYW